MNLLNVPLVFRLLAGLENWPAYFRELFGHTGNDIKYVTLRARNGLNYAIRARTSDRAVLTTVVFVDEYQLQRFHLPPDTTVIDIGGHIGTFSLAVSPRAAKVYIFEPVPDNYAMICRNIKMNNLARKLMPYNCAVAGKKRELVIQLYDESNAMHSAYGHGARKVRVAAISLQEIFDQNKIDRCSLLKIDCEGSEYEIFYNLPGEYLSRIQNICMEYHDLSEPRFNHRSLGRFLRANGFYVKLRPPIIFACRNLEQLNKLK